MQGSWPFVKLLSLMMCYVEYDGCAVYCTVQEVLNMLCFGARTVSIRSSDLKHKQPSCYNYATETVECWLFWCGAHSY